MQIFPRSDPEKSIYLSQIGTNSKNDELFDEGRTGLSIFIVASSLCLQMWLEKHQKLVEELKLSKDSMYDFLSDMDRIGLCLWYLKPQEVAREADECSNLSKNRSVRRMISRISWIGRFRGSRLVAALIGSWLLSHWTNKFSLAGIPHRRLLALENTKDELEHIRISQRDAFERELKCDV